MIFRNQITDALIMYIETCRAVAFPWLCDQNGHLNTSRYVEMFDVALYHLVDALQASGTEDAGRGWADVKQAIEYRVEVPIGAVLLVRSRVTEIGRSSFSAHHLMTDPRQRTTYATLRAKTVRLDLKQRRSTPLSPEFIEGAKALFRSQGECEIISE